MRTTKDTTKLPGMAACAACLLFVAFQAKAQPEPLPADFDSVGYLAMQTGAIGNIADTWLIVSHEEGREQRYVPVNGIPEAFREEGLEVAFNAVLGRIPPHVRMMGHPVFLRDLRKLAYAVPKDD